MWKTQYLPPNEKIWQAYLDAPSHAYFFQNIRLLNLLQAPTVSHSNLSFALLGFCCDEGIKRNLGREGAKEGPLAIRQMLAKLAFHRTDIDCYDAGDIICNDGHLEKAQEALAQAVLILLQQNIIPIVLGGGHELAWGHYRGLQKHYPKEKIAIVNIDAHLDMRPLLSQGKGSSGTSFLQIANAHSKTKQRFNYFCIGVQPESNIPQLIKTAREHHTQIIWLDDLQTLSEKNQDMIDVIIADHDAIYLSLCLDVFAAAYAPGVSAAQAFGATPWQIIPFIRQIAASKKVISYDIAELSPVWDQDQRTAKLAAHFVFEMIQHHLGTQKPQ